MSVGSFVQAISDLVSWKTDRKLLVFESDDWGALYLPSEKRLSLLERHGVISEARVGYLRLDALESRDDLQKLFNVLAKYSDSRGRPAKFTFNTVMGNPDFEKISRSNFERYFFQHFFDSYQEYNQEDNRGIWGSAISDGLIAPQFHAREHLNIRMWMEDLRSNRSDTRWAFENRFYALPRSQASPRTYMAAYWPFSYSHLEEIKEITIDGLRKFEVTFGYPSRSFVACSFVLPSEIERTTAEEGVRLIQTQRRHRSPTISNPNKKRSRISGWKNSCGQTYSVRNVFFEPFESSNEDWAKMAFEQTSQSFSRGRPAVVSTHRVNYVGRCDKGARDEHLRQLDGFLSKVTQTYSDIEFISSDELLSVMSGGSPSE